MKPFTIVNIIFIVANIYFFSITYNTYQYLKVLDIQEIIIKEQVKVLTESEKKWIEENAPLINPNDINI